MKYCQVCKEEFVPTNNRQKYCKECGKQVHKEQVKKANIKYYSNLAADRETK